MIVEVNNKKDLKRFIYFVKDLYIDNPHYIYPLFSILKKELVEQVLKSNKYKALLCIKDEKIVGRLLYTFEYNVKTENNVCYFSYFDAINSDDVTKELFEFMEKDMSSIGIHYSEGTFAPYDPDNRRGILINGFDTDPIIFTSYNFEYYKTLLENYGFRKAHDTYTVKPPVNDENKRKLNVIGKYFEKRFDINVDYLDLSNVDSEINDIHKILETSTTDVIYQEAPSTELIRSVAINLKSFLNPKIIRIAREKETNEPVGFCFCMDDYNQVFKKLKGKLNVFKFLFAKKHITRVRGMMQYVVPKYQNTGLIGYMYKKIFDEFDDMGVTEFEAGTMMEGNPKAVESFSKLGGNINKTYRIYGKEI